MANQRPLILNFDDSVGAVAEATTIELSAWQEKIRFGCTQASLHSLCEYMQPKFPSQYGTVLLGSGDYHHLSWPLIAGVKCPQPFQVIVFDNHPDNMRFPFGVHCGSWVRKVALLPNVSHVHVVGITSSDISWRSAAENYWWPLLRGKLTYWAMDVDVRWATLVGLSKRIRCFAEPDLLIAAFLQELALKPTYLSIDKDVLSSEVVQTNWDQGRLQEQHLLAVINALKTHIIGSDITGDVSCWQYRTWWKRLLSGLDAQPSISTGELAAMQAPQQQLNQQLLQALAASSIDVNY